MGKFNAVLFGGILGAAAALLLAPRTGEETRALVTGKVNDLLGRLEDEAEDGDGFVAFSTVEDIEDGAKEATDEMKEKLEAARARIASQVSKNIGELSETVKDKLPQVAQQVADAAGPVMDKVSAAVEVVAEKAQDLAGDLAERLSAESDGAEGEEVDED